MIKWIKFTILKFNKVEQSGQESCSSIDISWCVQQRCPWFKNSYFLMQLLNYQNDSCTELFSIKDDL